MDFTRPENFPRPPAEMRTLIKREIPASPGGHDGTTRDMAVIAEHLAHQGLGLCNDLHNESSILGDLLRWS